MFRKSQVPITVALAMVAVTVWGCAGTIATGTTPSSPPSGYTGPLAESPELKEGDSWVFRETSGAGSRYRIRVVGASPDGYVFTTPPGLCGGCLIHTDKQRVRQKLTDRSGQPLPPTYNFQNAVGRYDWVKEEQPYNFPMWLGKKWSFTVFRQAPRIDFFWSLYNEMEVVAYEDVTVPAGTFKAFRIQWYVRNDMRSNRGAAWRTLWYASEAKIILKGPNFELESYTFK